ncbi:MAG: hypothetical protein K2J82_09020 [Muribaculaceae bacterium]|nr:hypothetical protein [Muribaculaceae bacterium]MDE6754735.1 hypothetical protein [Muribaculaceae bacterium]
MTEIRVTLDDNADVSLLRKMIENMKGVISTSLKSSPYKQETEELDSWLETLHGIREKIDPSLIDLNDERTLYILSK